MRSIAMGAVILAAGELDHDDFGLIQSKIMNVIDSIGLVWSGIREEKWFALFLVPLQGMRPLIEGRAGPGKMMRRLRLNGFGAVPVVLPDQD